ncbi:MAG: helicase-related protein [Acidimicrobiales bacterium]
MQAEERPASPDEQAVLARWSGWGSLPKVFDPADGEYGEVRDRLRELLSDREWAAASRTTLNAHYTSFEAADAIWQAVRRAGFTGGRVLEPGVGSGTFLATRPGDIETIGAVGVEVDPVTAGIARLLHPEATIRSESFAVTRYPDGWFDLTVGNVPFGNYKLFDPLYNPAGLTIHNHFIHKSLAMTRPGGYVAVLTSRYTLDAVGTTARSAMAETADLIGALRLPDGAMQRVAGTDAAMDVLVLRRRLPGAGPAGESWLGVTEVDTPDGQVRLNEVFAAHPDWVLGEVGIGRGRYSDDELVIRPRTTVVDGREGREPLGPAMNAALARMIDQGLTAGLGITERVSAPDANVATGEAEWVGDVTIGPHHVEGSLLVRERGGFACIESGVPVPYAPPAAQGRELERLIELRDTYFEVIDGQAASPDDTDWEAARQALNTRYDAYVRLYGPVNRYRTYDTGRKDDEGQPVHGRRWPPMGGFRSDPGLAVVRALEDFDDVAQSATKAPVFERRVLSPRQPVTAVERPEDALALCLDERGTVDVETIARLLGCDPAEARTRLATLVFDDPDGGPPVPAAVYLSGHVRSKLRVAHAALAEDGEAWQVNVTALEAAQPRDLEPAEIDARLGAPWIPQSDVKAFCTEVLDAHDVKVGYTRVTGTWTLAGTGRGSLALTSDWGTRRMDGIHLTEAACNQSEVTVTDPDPSDPDGRKRVVNLPETLAAREKKDAISERFATWVWEDQARAARLVEEYNELFNSTVLPGYDGSHLSFPGLADGFVPHPHQRDAVWRILSEPSTLLAHAVGAGKTATMVMAGREMKRLGLVSRPCYIVPNHMLEQFSREYVQLYPDAKILVAAKDDVTPARRKELVARCAVQDWDAVIMTSSSFERIAVSADTEAAFLEAKSAELRAAIAQSRKEDGGDPISVKALEKALLRSEERHARLLDERRDDGGVTFEATGIDYLIVDEAHRYKNLYFPTRIQGVSASASKRAEDLDMKLRWLRQTKGARVTTFATATPISNSIAEMWVMQHYLQPGALEAAGIEHFDGWAATFARAVTALEMAPDTTSYRMKTRFARFANVPDLLRMFRAVADVRRIDQLALVVPDVAGGAAETVVVAGTETLKVFGLELAERAAQVSAGRVDPHDDNMLKITSDGRKAALDLRLVGLDPDPTGGKLGAAADRIAGTYHRNSDLEYPGSSRRGALQLVFLDLSTPKDDGRWNAYDELRSGLSVRGVPRESIRFIHEARNDAEKARLFAAARSGAISVLIGSTERMGVGTNVQDRVVALHDVDCPWRPADLEQRAGRAIRQGNANRVVALVRYVTRDSFDPFFWQTVERKAAFIHQIMAGEVTERWVEDVGDEALSYAEVKALATGDPRIMERAGVASELSKLQRLEAAWRNEQSRLQSRASASERDAGRFANLAAALSAAAPHAVDTSGERFAVVLAGRTYDKRVDAADALRRMALRDCALAGGERKGRFGLGQLAGFDLAVTVYRDREETSYGFHLDGIPTGTKLFSAKQMSEDAPLGMILQIEHLAENLEHRAAEAEREAVIARRDTDQARERLGRPFEHTDRLATLSARLEQVDASLTSDEPLPAPASAREAGETDPGGAPDGSGTGRPPAPRNRPETLDHGRRDPHAPDQPSAETEPRAWYDDARRLHREDGPAYIAVDGSREWWVHGQRHRDDGPAIEAADGTRAWYRHGELHRRGGPALESGDGRKQWFHHGIRQPRPQPSPAATPELDLVAPTPVGIDL